MRYGDIDPQDVDPETGAPYLGYSSPSLSDNPHAALHRAEFAQEKSDLTWFRFVATIEKLAGMAPNTLDGDDGHGMSLDDAHDAWTWGWSAREYFVAVRDHGARWAEDGGPEADAPIDIYAEQRAERKAGC